MADLIVSIIDEFNIQTIDQHMDTTNIIEELKVSLCRLKEEIITNAKIKIYFYGKDKYNILEKSLIKDFEIIKNIDEYKNSDKKSQYSQINVLIVSEETINNNLDSNSYFNDIIYYDKLMNYMFNISGKIYYSNYDYNYLLKSLEKSKSKDIETIVVGNSYPLTGIDAKLLKDKTVSLALSSQDLYYPYKLAKLAINNNNNIKRCIIGAGYYLVNHDLSKSRSEDAIDRVKNVYYPILKDKHNSEQVDSIEIPDIKKVLNDNVINYIFDLSFIDTYFKDLIYRDNNGYFNLNFKREVNNMLGLVKLSDISEQEKWRLGECRADQHNKLSKYTKTTDEYNHIFNEFIGFLEENNIDPIIVIFPNTKYYSNFLDKNYENEFYNIMKKIKERYKVKIIDFSKENIFLEEDFIDFDHMSEAGAIKITKEINNLLQY
ncbi:hypothetical protein [[Clostridium] dakarense]|uniref:hypothetical protein n=1 Tax=Faecalimicrobium dakarense TaxID=1301100 RepID=UPI0004B57535|nr:hypothetical protein [[Clostridium] dakarense]